MHAPTGTLWESKKNKNIFSFPTKINVYNIVKFVSLSLGKSKVNASNGVTQNLNKLMATFILHLI